MLDIKNLPVYKNPNIKIKVSKKKSKHMDTLYKSNKTKHDDLVLILKKNILVI